MPDEIAEKLVDEEKPEAAIARLESVLETADNPVLRLRMASLQFRVGKVSDALAHARRAREGLEAARAVEGGRPGADDDHLGDAVLLVSYCLRTLKRWREAARTFLEFADLRPGSPRARTCRFSAGLCLEELDDWAGAIGIYEAIGDSESEFRRAICLERNGRADEAAALFETFIERHGDTPESLKVRFRLGAMRVRQGRYEEAERHLAVVVKEGSGTFLCNIASQLIERARAKSKQVAKQLKSYS